MIFDTNLLQMYLVEQNMDQWRNPDGRYWNHQLFESKILSWSPFSNAVVFTTITTAVTGVTVSPATANIAQGSQMVLSAAVAGTGFFNSSVVWSISGNTSNNTYISDGKLIVGVDEPAETEITVTATSAEDSTKSGTATITVVAR
jgi:hypothetical protein